MAKLFVEIDDSNFSKILSTYMNLKKSKQISSELMSSEFIGQLLIEGHNSYLASH